MGKTAFEVESLHPGLVPAEHPPAEPADCIVRTRFQGDDFVNRTVMLLKIVVDSMFGENAYIAYLEGREDCLVFDPGFEYDAIIDQIETLGRTPAAILNTHGHADHIAGNHALKKRWPNCPLVVGERDAVKLTDAVQNLSRPFGLDVLSPPADRLVQDGELFEGAGLELEVLEVPGHSAGHVVYLWKGGSPWVAFVGDVIFQGGVGRTDFPDGNTEQLLTAIRTRIYGLPEDTKLLPGHGPATTVAVEKRSNPFVRG